MSQQTIVALRPDDIKKKLEQNWLRYIKQNSEKFSSENLAGSSPPSVFVGEFGYPKVRVGPMVPPIHGDTMLFDKPESWTGRSLEDIASYRLSLVRGVSSVDATQLSGRYIQSLQELAMSIKSTDADLTFTRKPMPENLARVVFHAESPPFGPSAPLKQLSLSSTKADNRIESAYYDSDLKASEAILKLYSAGVDVSAIHRVLSVGILGLKKSRRLVPTRWSITATDDTISKHLISILQRHTSISSFEVAHYEHLDNSYAVILLPSEFWSFELIENWYTPAGDIAWGSDFENSRGLDHYPETAGAYFAARLAVSEHLEKRGRKAKGLVLREIRPGYVMPLGVWQIREGVRQALKSRHSVFDEFEKAFQFAISKYSASLSEVKAKSRTYDQIKLQARITDF